MMKFKKRAFSLIELSISIIIIGIILVGITQASRMVNSYKLVNARNFTNNSTIPSMKNLVLWLETTRQGSILNQYSEENFDEGDDILSWTDKTPTLYKDTVFTAPSSSKRPQYVKYGINDLPSIKFQRSSAKYFENNDGIFDAGTETFSVFLVYRTVSTLAASQHYLLMQGRPTLCAGGNHFAIFAKGSNHLEYESCSGSTSHSINTSQNFVSGSTFATAVIRNGDSVSIYDTSLTPVTSTPNANPLGSLETKMTIGAYSSSEIYGFDGEISEIIAFDRILKTSEIRDVMSYISQKYDIEVTGL